MVAGLPMANGTDVLADFVPSGDATVVTRALAAGAEIVGKTTNEYLCMSGGSHTAHSGAGAQPAPDGDLGGRLVQRERGGARHRRRGHDPRRRPGRVHPDARVVVRVSSVSSRPTASSRTRASPRSRGTSTTSAP